MTHTPTAHLQALRDAVSTAEQLQQQPSAEGLQALIDQIAEMQRFKSFKHLIEAWSNAPAELNARIEFLLNSLRSQLQGREMLEGRDVFNTQQAADYVDLSVQSVKEHYTYTGYLKGELLSARQRIFRKAELDDFLKLDLKSGRRSKQPLIKRRLRYMNQAPAEDPVNQSARYDELDTEQQTAVRRWITDQLENYSLAKYSSNGLAVAFKEDGNFEISNGAMKGAMLAAGYVPVDTDAINWKFKKPSRRKNG